jgi:hypothetical protein
MSKIMQLADAYAFHIPGSSYSDEARAALQAEVERMDKRLSNYDEKLSAVMPSDFKDWHDNSRNEWPELTALVITNLRERLAEEQKQVELMEQEIIEQARLNGMGAERELALMAKVERMEDSAETLRYEMDALQAEVTRARNDERIAMAWLSDVRVALGKDCDFPTMVREIAALRKDAELHTNLIVSIEMHRGNGVLPMDIEDALDAIDAARSKQ